MFRRALAGHALALVATVSTRATTQATARDMLHVPGRDVTMSLITVGVGDKIAEMFGHTALRVRNTVDGRDTVFNWGEFDMSQPHFILHFMRGLNLYRLGGAPMDSLLQDSRSKNRSVTEQELALTSEQRDSIISIIRVNAEPQNVVYRYDYFVDNCATRPRDILDRVLGGQLRDGADSLTAASYRDHALRLMQSDKPLVVGVDIALGRPADRLITKWQEMFLPQKLHDWVATRQVRDSTRALHPLVRREEVLFQASRPPDPTAPPNLARWLTLLGVVIVAAIVVLQATGGSVGLTIVCTAWALVCGLLGCVLTALWAFTDHRFSRYNENLLLFNPIWLALVMLLPIYLSSGRAARATRGIVFVVAGLSALALVAHLVLLSRQANLALIGLSLPPTAALAYIVATSCHVARYVVE